MDGLKAPPPDGEVPTLREEGMNQIGNLRHIERITTHHSQELAAAAMKMHVAGLDGRVPRKLS